MSEMIESVKDIFKGGGGDKKKKMILFSVAAAGVVGVALYMRSKSGDASIASADTAGTGDDTGGGGVNPQEADLSGLIDGFGSEIDRLDNRIANLGAVGSGYTTLDGSGYVAVPNTDNMAAYSPEPEPMMVSTSTPYESKTLSFAAANGLAEGGDPAIAASNAALASVYRAPVAPVTVPVPAASAAVAVRPVPVALSFAAAHGLAEGGDSALAASIHYAPAAEKLVVAPKPQNYTPSNVITYVQATPPAIAPKGSSAAATLNNPLAPAGAKMQAAQSVSVKPVQPVAAVKTVAASPTVKVAAATNSNISRFIQAIVPPKPAPKPAPKPVVKPVSAMQSGYNAYMAGR